MIKWIFILILLYADISWPLWPACSYVLHRLRKLVSELEPEVTEVPQLFRLVLCDCLDEQHEDLTFRERSLRARAIFWSQHRSKSIFSIGLSSHQCLKNHWSKGEAGQDRETLCEEDQAWAKDEELGVVVPLRWRVRSMPDFSSIKESAQTWQNYDVQYICIYTHTDIMIMIISEKVKKKLVHTHFHTSLAVVQMYIKRLYILSWFINNTMWNSITIYFNQTIP